MKAFPVFLVLSTWDVLQELLAGSPLPASHRGEDWVVLSAGAEGKSHSVCKFRKLTVVFVLNKCCQLLVLSVALQNGNLISNEQEVPT